MLQNPLEIGIFVFLLLLSHDNGKPQTSASEIWWISAAAAVAAAPQEEAQQEYRVHTFWRKTQKITMKMRRRNEDNIWTKTEADELFFSLETVPTREESMLVNSAVPLVTRTTRKLFHVQQREIKCHKRRKMKSKYCLEMWKFLGFL